MRYVIEYWYVPPGAVKENAPNGPHGEFMDITLHDAKTIEEVVEASEILGEFVLEQYASRKNLDPVNSTFVAGVHPYSTWIQRRLALGRVLAKEAFLESTPVSGAGLEGR